MRALALKYRPLKFEDVVCQDNIKVILENQLSHGEFKQAYLFCGGAGTGKTTSARIFANEVNNHKGRPIEIDGASNNGVDNIRELIDDCKMRAFDSLYKVYIIDECHMLSTGAWNSFLKVLEEPPKGVIFILCTTDPQKIPATILSRVQRFDFRRIPTKEIVNRLHYILEEEKKEMLQVNGQDKEIIQYEEEALEYIAKLADGGMRDAITKLDTVLGYSNVVTVEKVLNCLGITQYIIMSDLIENIYSRNGVKCLEIINDLFLSGKDLKLFVKDMSKYILDICKYTLTNDFSLTYIPQDHYNKVKYISCELVDIDFLLFLLDVFNNLQNNVKYEQNPRAIIESEVILSCLKW